jgi:uncharacterized protein (UPF0333 family)
MICIRKGTGLPPYRSKAQAGVEYIVLVAFLLLVITPVFLYAFDVSSRSVRTTRAKEAVDSIAIAADNICSLGGGKTTVDVYMPYGSQNYTIGQKTIRLNIRVNGVAGDVFSRTMCNVTGNISLSEGYTDIPVSMLPNGTVLIGGS